MCLVGRISQQMTIDADRSSNTGMAETMADNHVVPKVTALGNIVITQTEI